MVEILKFRSIQSVIVGVLVSASLIAPINLHAQVLEEIIVTAQRREQSLQEVPISMDVIDGVMIEKRGYRNLGDLAKWSPAVATKEAVLAPSVAIRGFTSPTNLTVESVAPTFVDGIHFGSPHMSKNSFLDVGQLEVLKGPQPLYFGNNATAGAINIRSRRPVINEFDANLALEMGNDGRREVLGAINLPVTDTLAFRLAAMTAHGDGVAKSYFDGDKFPRYNQTGGRLSMQWNPTDNYSLYAKLDLAKQRSGTVMVLACRPAGIARGFSHVFPTIDPADDTVDAGNEYASVVPPPSGVSNYEVNYQNSDGVIPRRVTLETDDQCFEGDYAWNKSGPFVPSPPNVVSLLARGLDVGAVNMIDVMSRFLSQEQGPNWNFNNTGFTGIDAGGLRGHSNIDNWSSVIEATYTFDNGVSIQSQTGLVDFDLRTGYLNNEGHILMNPSNARHDMFQLSEHLRIASPDEGVDIADGLNLEWMFGGFYQRSHRDFYSMGALNQLNRGIRINSYYENIKTKSAFGQLKFNFLDDQVYLDVGGRYTDVNKDMFYGGTGQMYIFDEMPCDSEGTDDDIATCTLDPDFKRVDPTLTTFTVHDPITGNGRIGSTIYITSVRNYVRIDSPLFLAEDADLTNLWTINGYETRARPRIDENVPRNWRGADGAHAVGITAPARSSRNGPFGQCAACVEPMILGADDFNLQVVLSATPNMWDRDHTFYAKYAEGFKGPFIRPASGTIPASLSDVIFLPEFAAAWEIGARGTLLDQRLRYEVSAFLSTVTDLQIGVATSNLNPTAGTFGRAANAGAQEVKGIEFNLTYGATDRLVLNFGGAIMKGEFTKEFNGGGCTPDERIAASIDALANPGSRTAGELAFAQGTLDLMGPTRVAALPSASELPDWFFLTGGCRLEATAEGPANSIDRTGYPASQVPAWSFVGGATYTMPVLDNYQAVFEMYGSVEDERFLTAQSREVAFAKGHGDMDFLLSFGPTDGRWLLTGYLRNIFEDRPVFNQEYELERTGYVSTDGINQGGDAFRGVIQESMFMAYGVRFEHFW